MENSIQTTTRHPNKITSININNSTDFKEFEIENTSLTSGTTIKTSVKIDASEPNVKVEIDNVSLVGREIDLLIEFLNQINN